jgi:SulP family sulfate permease
VNDSSAKSQGAVVVAAAVGLFLLFGDASDRAVAEAALGGSSSWQPGLIDFRSIWRLRHVRPAEVGLALVAFGGVLVFGVLGGVVVAISLSIGVFLYRSARPHDAVLGRVEDVMAITTSTVQPETVPGLLVYRRSALLRQRRISPPARARARREAQDVRWLVLNAEAWFLDATAIDALSQLHAELEERRHALHRPPERTAARDLRRNRPYRTNRGKPLFRNGAVTVEAFESTPREVEPRSGRVRLPSSVRGSNRREPIA